MLFKVFFSEKKTMQQPLTCLNSKFCHCGLHQSFHLHIRQGVQSVHVHAMSCHDAMPFCYVFAPNQPRHPEKKEIFCWVLLHFVLTSFPNATKWSLSISLEEIMEWIFYFVGNKFIISWGSYRGAEDEVWPHHQLCIVLCQSATNTLALPESWIVLVSPELQKESLLVFPTDSLSHRPALS